MNPGDLFCVCILLAVSGAVAVYILDYVAGVGDLSKRCREAEGERDILLESVECLKNEGRRCQETFEALDVRCRNLSGTSDFLTKEICHYLETIKSLEGERDKLAVQNAALNSTLETYKKWESSRPGNAIVTARVGPFGPLCVGLGSIKFGR